MSDVTVRLCSLDVNILGKAEWVNGRLVRTVDYKTHHNMKIRIARQAGQT